AVVCNAGDVTPAPVGVSEPVELVLDAHPAAVRGARTFVEREAIARGADGVVDDLALIAAELIANALQHGTPPIQLVVSGDSHLIRVAVHDSNPLPPVRPTVSTVNMTGRGLALVGALATSWGVDPIAGDGKTVWAELATTIDLTKVPSGTVDLDTLLASWPDAGATEVEGRHTVVLGDVPTDLLLEAKSHIDNLVREFSLAATSAELGSDAPEHLARLIQTVVHGFAEARDAIKRQAIAAARRAEPRTRLNLNLPLSAADA